MCKIKNQPKLSFQLINNVAGWLTFIIASVTYLLTIEPTTSLWDCGEFITTSVGLQVGHPPGAPLFMILSRLFAIFAPSPEKQAMMVNAMSALASAATIMFLFWTISHLARKLVMKQNEECSIGQVIAVIGSALVGALTYTFSDTFWFSAVEGEVYALSSLFTAVVFWAILKWENVAFERYSNRWLILIAYLIGLSIGVHLLNLLAIPAIVFVYYFKKYNPTRAGIIKAGGLSIIILGVIMWGVIPGVVKVAGWFELMFTNGMGLPFNTGVIVYAILLIGGLAYGIRLTMKRGMPIWNTILTCFVVILIGYSSYAMIVIRSASNPPIDENSPDNVFALRSYLNRDQYGESPLVYGQYYNAPLVAIDEGEAVYYQNHTTGKYDKIGNKYNYTYDKRFCTIFPRMHSNSRPYNPQFYQAWGGKLSGPVYQVNGEPVQAPSFGNNLRYFFNYQLVHMYWRYFMWNFSGRQNDTQGHGDIRYGNWVTGIPFIDSMLLGNQDELPDILKNAKGKNEYYLLPFLLGILGMIYQYKRGKSGKQDFWTVMLLFFFTGVAIILYLNQPPMEPRERDYAYAGSFYAYSIWIGLGMLAIFDLLRKKLNATTAASVATVVCLFAVPVNMAAENGDDHDRSGRYATIAHAKNYLNSCAPNAILFTYGDNDTFPLWYAQEVEGVRRDIRIVNLSLLQGGWYIDQMKRKAYEGAGVPISYTKDQYHDGVRDQVEIIEKFSSANLKDVMAFVGSDNTNAKVRYNTEFVNYFPTRKVIIPVDSAKVIANGTVKPEDAYLILPQLELDIEGNRLTKSQLMVLDILATNNWERPIYFGIGMGRKEYLGMEKFFQLEGAAYRVVPIGTPDSDGYDFGRVDSDILYNRIMNQFEWGGIKNPEVNIDYFHENTIAVMKYRNTFLRLADQLGAEGKIDSAVAVLDKSLEEIPVSQVSTSDNTLLNYVPLYYSLGQTEKGNELAKIIANDNYQMVKYINSLDASDRNAGDIRRDEETSARIIQILMEYARHAKQDELANEMRYMLESIYNPEAQRTVRETPEKAIDSNLNRTQAN